MSGNDIFLLAGIAIIALDHFRVLVKFTVFVRAYWMKAQIVVRCINRRITTPNSKLLIQVREWKWLNIESFFVM